MNIDTLLDERLRSAIQSNYNNRDFTGAIVDAIYFLSDLIREKTGLESDGAALVSQAFGGDSPKLKVNKLETESEKNVQAGVEQMLRGLYLAVRNPRSHGKHVDKPEDADAIILFINYLVRIIDQSRTPFTKTEFLKRIFDPLFVKKKRYAELLAAEIPAKHRLEIMLDVLRSRETGDGNRLAFFAEALIEKLTEAQKTELYAAMSEELRVTDSESGILTILQIFPNDCLSHLEESARLRTETRLIESIREGSFNLLKRKCTAGVLGTWALVCYNHFLLKDELIEALVSKLEPSSSEEKQAYLFQFLWPALVDLTDPPTPRLASLIRSELKKGNKALYDKLIGERGFDDTKWVEAFNAEIATFKEQEKTADDDVPF